MANSDNKNNRASEQTPPPLPAAQDAGQAPLNPDVQTRPPSVQPPLTSSTGTGFNAPDAGTTVPEGNSANAVGNSGGPMSHTRRDEDPRVPPGSIDRDAQVGQEEAPGLQADAEAVSSTGPVSS